MTKDKGVPYIIKEVEKIVDHARKEFNMTYEELLGALEFIKCTLTEEALDNEDTIPDNIPNCRL